MRLIPSLKNSRKACQISCWIAVTILASFPAYAAEPVKSSTPGVKSTDPKDIADPKDIVVAPAPEKAKSPIGVKIGIPGWLSAISGQVGAKNRVSNAKYISFTGLLDHVDYVIPGSIELSYGKWGLLIDGQFTKLSQTLNPRDVLFNAGQINMEQAFIDFNVSYKVVDTEKLSFAPFIGTRLEYVNIQGSLTPTPANPIPLVFNHSANQLWADPLFGFQTQYKVYKPFSLVAKADVGGFGAASHLTYQLFGGAEVQVTKNFNISIGYRYMDTDYQSGGFTYDLAFSGPQITCGVNF